MITTKGGRRATQNYLSLSLQKGEVKVCGDNAKRGPLYFAIF